MKFRAEDNQGLSQLSCRQRSISMNFAIVSSIAAIIGVGSVTGSILNLLAIKLGAGELFLGILNFAYLAPFAAGLLTLSAVERVGKRRVLLVWFFIASVFVLPFLFLPVLINQLNFSYRYCLIVILVALISRQMIDMTNTTSNFHHPGSSPRNHATARRKIR